MNASSNSQQVMFAKVVDLGKLTLDTNAGTFTDGSSMPTVTECGVSRTTCGVVIAEITTALSATPGSISITYVDQDGHTAEATTAQSMAASAPVGNCGFVILNTGDTGVRDITTAVRSVTTTTGGVIQFWGIIPICTMQTSSGNVKSVVTVENLITSGFSPIRLGAGDRIQAFHFSTTAHNMIGSLFFIGDT